MAIFLAYYPPMSRKSQKNGKFTGILKCILWDFDKKSEYFLFLLSIYKMEWSSLGKKTHIYRSAGPFQEAISVKFK